MHDLLPDTSDVEIIEEAPLDEDALQAFKSSQERPAISTVDGVTWKALSTDDQNYFKLISRAGRQAILQSVMEKDGSKARKTFLTKQISDESQDDLQDATEDEVSENNDESLMSTSPHKVPQEISSESCLTASPRRKVHRNLVPAKWLSDKPPWPNDNLFVVPLLLVN